MRMRQRVSKIMGLGFKFGRRRDLRTVGGRTNGLGVPVGQQSFREVREKK